MIDPTSTAILVPVPNSATGATVATRATGATAAKGATQIEEPTRHERTIALRAAEARATVPHLELSTDVNIGAGVALAHEQSCSITAILARACALALREAPRANGAYRDGRFELYSRVNVGVGVVSEDVSAIPTVFDADRKSLRSLSDEIDCLADRARSGLLTPPELAGATFTLSDLSPYGVARTSTAISPPQAGALAAGAIREVPVVRNRAIVSGLVMTLTLACDHRILYGQGATRFLSRIEALLVQARL